MTRSPRQLLWPGSKLNPRAKKMTFSSAENSEILGGIIRDKSEVFGMVGAEVMEEALITGLLPKEPTAKLLASTVYMKGLREALVGLLREIANDESKRASSDQLAIAEFTSEAIKFSHWSSGEKGDEANSAAVNAVSDLIGKMKAECASMALDDEDLNDVLECTEDMYFRPSGVANGLVRNWRFTVHLPEAFETLALLVEASSHVDDYPENRVKFVELLCNLGDAWRAKLRIASPDEFVVYEMADRSYVQVPSDWLVANPEDALLCDYAGVFEVKNGHKYNQPDGAPHILFFCSRPVHDLDELETIDLRRSAITVWPELEDVYADEIEPEWGVDENGLRCMLNSDEYAASPIVGMFGIQEANPRTAHPIELRLAKRRPFGAGIFRDWDVWEG